MAVVRLRMVRGNEGKIVLSDGGGEKLKKNFPHTLDFTFLVCFFFLLLSHFPSSLPSSPPLFPSLPSPLLSLSHISHLNLVIYLSRHIPLSVLPSPVHSPHTCLHTPVPSPHLSLVSLFLALNLSLGLSFSSFHLIFPLFPLHLFPD